MIVYVLSNLGMGGGGTSLPPLALAHIDPSQTTQLVITSDTFDLDPEQTTLLP